MAEPKIQYAKTSDGVNIAYATVGRGAPLVLMPALPFTHLQLDWKIHEARLFYEHLSQNRMLVRYDGRGSGVSDRDVTDYSLDAQLSDLEAVVDRLGVPRFALLGYITTVPAAIAYATRHAERVTHLVLWCGWARGADFFGSSQAQGLLGLVDKDWELFTETLAHAGMGWSEGTPAHQWAAVAREGVTPEAAKGAMKSFHDVDVANLLPQIKSTTLVLHPREAPMPDVKVAMGLVSRIPDARLVLLEGSAWAIYLSDTEAVVSALDEFLGEGAAESTEPGAFRTILFTDVEGSTALTDRLGDAKARDLLREHEGMVREALKAHGGSEIKTLGDGFMTSFSSSTRALECAIAIQSAFAERNESAEEPIKVRIGLNAGEPIAEDDDLYGTAVNLAARIAAQAKGGEILASEAVRQIVAGKKFPFSDRGETALRGFEDRVHIYQVSWREGH